MCQRRAVPSKGGRRLEEGRADERGRKVNSAGRLRVCTHTRKCSGEFCCGDKGLLVAAQRGVDFGKPLFSALVSAFWKLRRSKLKKLILSKKKKHIVVILFVLLLKHKPNFCLKWTPTLSYSTWVKKRGVACREE